MTEPDDGRDREPRKGTNVLALVAGALIALIAVLAFLALMSRRSGAQDYHASPAVVQEMVSVPGNVS